VQPVAEHIIRVSNGVPMADNASNLPPHIGETVQAIAAVHVNHYREAPPLQRIVSQVTAVAGRPGFVVFLTFIILLWMFANLAIMWSGRAAWDPPPFNGLAAIASIVALYTTVLILTTQRYDDELARHREMLTLEIATLNERKSAKIIQMLEQMRRDSPHLANHADNQAQVMSDTADPDFILNALKDAHKLNEE
jgi:uncharacterized membrane protein